MITIVEPKEHIDKLWGKQRVREDAVYRLMRYVLRVDHDGKVLLHNVITGRLVVLGQKEAEALEKLPKIYNPVIEQLVTEHYLVPEDYNEHQAVVSLRSILWKLDDTRRKNGIVYYTILPTTACNARCWYCFEQGVKTSTMSEETADEVVRFIVDHTNGKPITIRWFGGEPTIAASRIDQICQGLRSNNVDFTSVLSTNGYLLDEKKIVRAKEFWNLKQATITIDGTEKTTNRVKAFAEAEGSPYQSIMQNIGCLLEKGIRTGLRMNLDQDNWSDFPDLLADVSTRFHDHSLLNVYVHQIVDYEKEVCESNEEWYQEKILELNNLSKEYGLYRKKLPLPYLYYQMCEAANDDAVTITPDGYLVCCGEQLGNDQIKGNLKLGITNEELVKSWKQFADYDKCRECVLFPDCPSMKNCRAKNRCYRKLEKMNQYTTEMCELFNDFSNQEEE